MIGNTTLSVRLPSTGIYWQPGIMSPTIASLFRSYLRLGAHPDDRDSVRLAKNQFMFGASTGILFISIVSLAYVWFGEPMAGFVGFSVAALLSLNTALFAVVHRSIAIAFTVQISLTFIGTLLASFVLGSLANVSGVFLYGLVLVILSGRYFKFWFAMYLLMLAASLFLQPYPRDAINLPPKVFALLWLFNLTGASFNLMALFRYAIEQRNKALHLLRAEQEKAESLLLNILPRDIAAVLKNGPKTIAEHFNGTTILFADLVNFTPLSSTLEPIELVELLNDVFSEFDSLVEKYDLEKIKTIGDCYMVASGVPRKRADHAEVMIRMALEMQQRVAQREYRGHRLVFRIGVNSGAVVAGVIGRKKFIYDLWGDAVNIASRMESHGTGGMIQITQSTHELVKDKFDCAPRGQINVKGKGEMDVWHVGKESAHAQ